MSKPFRSIALALITVQFYFSAPALAQRLQAPATGYGTGESIQISGWQSELLRRNKGLEKFHWSPIKTVQHYRTIPTAAKDPTASKQPIYVKPQVVSTWNNPYSTAASAKLSEQAKEGVNINLNRRDAGTNAYASARNSSTAPRYQQPQQSNDGAESRRVATRVLQY